MSKRYLRFINTVFIVTPISFIMAFVGTTRHHGFAEGWGWKFITSWCFMLPIAFLAAYVIAPQAKRLAEKLASK